MEAIIFHNIIANNLFVTSYIIILSLYHNLFSINNYFKIIIIINIIPIGFHY
jgi:hypothetical protein